MDNVKIEKLESLGFKRWTKGDIDRLYVNASVLGLECDYYNTGNIKYAEFNGEHISNCQARRMREAKTFIDIKTGKLHSTNPILLRAAENLIEKE